MKCASGVLPTTTPGVAVPYIISTDYCPKLHRVGNWTNTPQKSTHMDISYNSAWGVQSAVGLATNKKAYVEMCIYRRQWYNACSY